MLTFWLLATLIVIGAVGVVTLKQPVHAALCLVGTLLVVAVVYVTLQAHFLAAIQVIVYAGAIMVLFLFVIMLLSVQGEEERRATLAWANPLAFGVGLIAAAAIAVIVLSEPRPLGADEVIAAALQGGGAAQIASVLFSDFALAFQLVGVLLLTGIVAAVSMVERKAETDEAPDEPRGEEARRKKRELIR